MSTGQGAVLARCQFLHMPNSSGGGMGARGSWSWTSASCPGATTLLSSFSKGLLPPVLVLGALGLTLNY